MTTELRVLPGGRGEAAPRRVTLAERHDALRERVEGFIEEARLDLPRDARPAFAAQAERVLGELEALGEVLGVE